jgi:tetratricopeptide (TPR) repeat protein
MEVELLRQHLDANPADQGAQVRLGLAYLRLGRAQDAVQAFELALQRRPGDPGLLVNLGSAQLQHGDREAARRSFESALSFDPHYAHALFNLGALAEGERRIDEAIQYYKEALRYDPRLGDLASNPALVRSQLAPVAQLQLFIETRSAPNLTVAPAMPLLIAPVEEPPKAASPPPPDPNPDPEPPPTADPDSIPPGD